MPPKLWWLKLSTFNRKKRVRFPTGVLIMETKKCVTCKNEKILTCFNRKQSSKDKLNSRCKECSIEYSKKHYINNKEQLINRNYIVKKSYKETLNSVKEKFNCFNCDCNIGICLDFHHIDELSKHDNVSYFAQCKSIQKIYNEILKCIVVCANCHRMIHAGLLEPNKDKIVKISFEEFKELVDKFKEKNGLSLKIKRPRRS